LKVNSNLINTDANSNSFQKSLNNNNKNSDLNNNVNSKDVLSPTQKNLTAIMKNSHVTKNNVTTKGSLKNPELNTDLLAEGNVTAVVAKVKYTEAKGQTCRKSKGPGRHCNNNNIIRVLLDNGSDGDLWLHGKGTPTHFPYLIRQVPLAWHMSNGSFLTKGIVRNTLLSLMLLSMKKRMTKSVYDLILGCTM
jgi:hypothetical protein